MTSENKSMRPTPKMRWLSVRAGELGANHPSAIRMGDSTIYLALQQWWIPISEFDRNADDWETWEAGEWRDIPIEDLQ